MQDSPSVENQARQAGPARHLRKVAVCGAGVMGAQIAAHCINAGVPVLLFDLPAEKGDKSAIARRAVAQLKKLNPAPLGAPDLADLIIPANYEDDLARLGECDLVRSEEHTSELQSLMRISYDVFCLKKTNKILE